jgi:hypothetical protein
VEEVTVNFVTKLPQGGFGMVLVEEGPWPHNEVEANLRRVQERLYNCVDAALDGQLAERFPESKGKPLVIRLDAYNLPEQELREFFALFAESVPRLPEYAAALAVSNFVGRMSFELSICGAQG